MQEMETRVSECKTVEESIALLVTDLADLLNDLLHDPIAIGRTGEELRAHAHAMSVAVVANTEPNAEPHAEPTHEAAPEVKHPKTKRGHK